MELKGNNIDTGNEKPLTKEQEETAKAAMDAALQRVQERFNRGKSRSNNQRKD